MNKQQEPRLRFKGFTGNWEEIVLEEVVNFFSGLTYSPNDVVKNGTLVLRSSNVQDNQITTEDNVFVKKSAVNCQNVEVGDVIVVVRNGSRSLIGKHAIIKEKMPNTVIGAFMTGVRSNQPDFLNALLDSYKFNQEIEKNLGATINQITTGAFRKMEFSLPSLPEQTHLGLFFRRLDSQIAESRAVLEKSRQLKKAMLAKMFPANGEKIPKIRFKGFEGEWESRRLGEIVDVVMGQSPPSTSYTDNPNNFILVQGNADMKNGKVCPRIWTTELTKQGKVGDIIMSVRAPVGDVGKTDYNIVIGRGVCAIKGDEFIYQTLWKMKSDCYWDAVSSGSTFEAVNSNDIKNAEVLIPPTPKEQIKIGNFFRQLDETIALQSAEVEKLNQLKKGLLAAMLV